MTKETGLEYRSTLSERAQPVHGRSLEIEIFNHGPDRVKVKGVIVDLRKQGFVPTGGDLQASGIIHHMLLDAVVRRSDLMLESLEPLQPIVAYEPSEATGGESCRDIAWRIPELVVDRSIPLLRSGFRPVSGGRWVVLIYSHWLTCLAQRRRKRFPWMQNFFQPMNTCEVRVRGSSNGVLCWMDSN